MTEPQTLDNLFSMSVRGNAQTRKIPRHIILHNSAFKAIWDWFVLVLVIYTAIEIPYSAAFRDTSYKNTFKSPLNELKAGSALAIVNLVVDSMFVVDIFINFRSTYTRKGTDELVVDPRKIACHYLKTWFVVDLLAAIPFELLVEAASLTGLLKTARLLRLVRIVRKLDRYSEYGLAVVILLTCLFTLVAHWLACIWHSIGEGERNRHGWIMTLATQIGQPLNLSVPGSGPSISDRYMTSLYFTLTSLTSIGFGNIAPNTHLEKLFAVLMMLIGALMYAAIFGNMTAIIQRLYAKTARYHRDLKVIKEFICFHSIPDTLRETLTDYFTHEWTAQKDTQLDNVLRRFPESLQADICVHIHREVFSRYSVFKSMNEGCMRALSIKFSIRNYLPGHYIIKEGDEVRGIYFIILGTLEVVKNERPVSILGAGDSAGNDYMLVKTSGHPKANASLMVCTYTAIHHVTWSDLFDVAKSFPELEDAMIDKMLYTHDFGRYITSDSGLVGSGPWSALLVGAPIGLSNLNLQPTPREERNTAHENTSKEKFLDSQPPHVIPAPSNANGRAGNENLQGPSKGTTNLSLDAAKRMENLDKRLERVEKAVREILLILKENHSGRTKPREMFSHTTYI